MIYFRGKIVCVTGAGGSIGSVIVDGLLRAGARVKAVSLTEGALYNLQKRHPKVAGILGNVADECLMGRVLHDVDIVINAAAHKHVPLCEANVIAAVENNAIGAFRLIEMAAARRVGQFVQVSTDKAVNPTSVMGMTKRVVERLLHAMPPPMSICVTRFGNVMDSAGSVLPLWREQITAGGPVTVTDKRCTRYMMTIPEAASLVLEAAKLSRTRAAVGPYIFDMGEQKNVYDMARKLIGRRRIRIKLTGLRPGEKLVEELNHGGQLHRTDHPKIFQVDDSAARPVPYAAWLKLVEACRKGDEIAARRALEAVA